MMSIGVNNPDLFQLIDDVSQVSQVKQGRTAVLVRASLVSPVEQSSSNFKLDSAGGNISNLSPLGVEPSTGYKVQYTASTVNIDGYLTQIASGLLSVNDKAPVLTALSTSTTYVNGQTPAPVFGFMATDPNPNDVAGISVEYQPKNGTLAIVDGNVKYTPNPDFVGVDTFTVRATDTYGAFSLKTATVTVVPPYDGQVDFPWFFGPKPPTSSR